jgi:hypothetical protein
MLGVNLEKVRGQVRQVMERGPGPWHGEAPVPPPPPAAGDAGWRQAVDQRLAALAALERATAGRLDAHEAALAEFRAALGVPGAPGPRRPRSGRVRVGRRGRARRRPDAE